MAYRHSDAVMNKPLRGALFFSRLLQWSSAVIVMGIASYFIAKYPRNEHIIYDEVIVRPPNPSQQKQHIANYRRKACTAVAFFLIPLFLSFVKRVTWHAAPLDLIYTYLCALPYPAPLQLLTDVLS